MASLGQEFKRTREERGITLHDIANSTHIGVRFLQAIENDSYDILPGGVFNRAFVRKFAKQIGYDEEQAIKLYEEQLDDRGGEPARRYYTGLDDIEARPTSGNGLLLSFLAIIVLAAGAYLAYSYFNAPATIPSQGIEILSPTPTPTATPNAAASAEATPAVSPSPGNLSTAAPAGALRLQLIAGNEQCWVKVGTDEARAEEATLLPGDVREFNATQKLTLNLGNIPAIRATINGRTINFAKLLPNQKGVVAKNVVITKDNYLQFVD